MKKYWTVFKISWLRELEYRAGFFLGRVRNIIVLTVTYFLWTHLAASKGEFLGYSQKEIVSYVLLASVLRTVIFGAQSRLTAQEINDGTFAMYLLRPVNHFAFVFFRELAQRLLFLISSIVEIIIFIYLTDAQLFWQVGARPLFYFFCLLALSIPLYFLLSYVISLIAFWTREAMGPRFLFEWVLELSSGVFFPLNIFSGVVFSFLSFLPFAQLIHFPIRAYLGQECSSSFLFNISMSTCWIIISGIAARFFWKRGLRHFAGEGI